MTTPEPDPVAGCSCPACRRARGRNVPIPRSVSEGGTIACPECDETWPDTYGKHGGRAERFRHVYAEHGEGRGLPFKKLES